MPIEPGFTKVALVGQVAEGSMIAVQSGEDEVLLARVRGELFAISNVCSHFRALLSDGELLPQTCEVRCPLHDSCFSLRTGAPSGLPAEDAVPTYEVKIVGDEVFVRFNSSI